MLKHKTKVFISKLTCSAVWTPWLLWISIQTMTRRITSSSTITIFACFDFVVATVTDDDFTGPILTDHPFIAITKMFCWFAIRINKTTSTIADLTIIVAAFVQTCPWVITWKCRGITNGFNIFWVCLATDSWIAFILAIWINISTSTITCLPIIELRFVTCPIYQMSTCSNQEEGNWDRCCWIIFISPLRRLWKERELTVRDHQTIGVRINTKNGFGQFVNDQLWKGEGRKGSLSFFEQNKGWQEIRVGHQG